MAIHKGIRTHQYLDDWLVRATSHQVCLQIPQDLVKICQELRWLVKLEKSELEPKQVFDLVGYKFDLMAGRKYLLRRRNFSISHSQSHPCGPGTCVGNQGSGWPEHWFECTSS